MTRRARGTAPLTGAPIAALALLAAMLVAACGAAAGTPSPAATPSTTPLAGASGEANGPQPTSWPGGVVEATVILGKADLDIKNAGADLGAAAAYEDLEAMYGAADGLATLIDRLIPQVDRIRDYPTTAAVAKAYDASLPDMSAGAHKIADSIKAGDSAGLTAGVEQLAKGTAAYEDARKQIGPLLETALLMQRILVK
jgi:hypothetical protein